MKNERGFPKWKLKKTGVIFQTFFSQRFRRLQNSDFEGIH